MNRDDLEFQLKDNTTDRLPEGWCWAELNEIVNNPKSDIVDGPFGSDLKSSEYTDKGVPIIRIQNVDRNKFIEKNIQFISAKKAQELKRHNFHPGDIVITKLGDPLGKACIVPENFGPGIVVADIVRLRLNHKFCSIPYLVHSINSEPVGEQLLRNIKGTTRPRVNLGHIRSLRIPLAPLPEQKRIVAKVEELLIRANRTKERLAKGALILKRFRQAVLTAACSGRLTADWRDKELHTNSSNQPLDGHEDLPSSWSWRSIRDLASSKKSSIQSGPFGSNLLHSEFQPTGILVIGIDNVLDGKFSFGKQHRISHQKYELLKKYAARPLDVLVTVMATVGRCCLVPSDIETAIITKHVYRITADHNAVNPYYLMQCIRGCPEVLAQIQGETQGVTRPGINGAILKRANIPLPPIIEQNEIVRRVEAMFRLADGVEKRVAAATMRAEKLTQAVLAKAFRGELVATEAELARREGRSYESASELLVRVKSEQVGEECKRGDRPRVKKKIN